LTPRLAQREIALAGVALLAAAVSLALTSGHSDNASKLPQPAGTWYTALAGARGPAAFGKRTACGQVIGADTVGVAHPVLPCGAKIYVAFGRKHVLTQVIDRGPYVPGRQFDLTEALANRLGVRGVQQIQWAYARTG
jgi:rare lipoprotein A (peptidoglycan hydrolase)